MYLDHAPDARQAHLSDEHTELVRATLPAVGENINTIARTFYGKMFTAHPELLRDTFNRGNQKTGEQQKALAASVATFATMLVDDNAPDPVKMLDRIAHKHVSLGIAEDQYQIVHDNLLAAVAEILGDAVTDDVAAAWSAVYWLMAEVLIKHEKELYATAGITDPQDVFREVTVTAKEALTDTVISYTVEGDLSEPRPGQYTSIGVRLDDGARQLRQYSIVSGDSSSYTIAVELDGEVSAHLAEQVSVGDTVQATLAAGDLVLVDAPVPAVLISSGIGSTPMVGMLSHLAAHDPDRKVLYLHADESVEAFAQREAVEGYVEKLNDATLHTAYRAHDERLDVSVHDLAGADVYLCGGTGFLQSVTGDLEALVGDKAPRSINVEMFSPNDWLIG